MLRIGYASVSMVPDRPAMLQGQMNVRVAKTTLDELTLNAMAIDNGNMEDAAILVSCDVAMISDQLLVDARAHIAKALPDFLGRHLVLFATHTHTSLVYAGDFYVHPGGDVMTVKECHDFLAKRVADVALQAWKNRSPGKVARAYGHAVIGHNRRPQYADGSTRMYGRADRPDFAWIEGYEDHSVDILFTWDNADRLTGVTLLVPCPSQVDEHLQSYSADYWHETRAELRKRHGASLNVLGVCGAAGDQSPHFILLKKEEAEMRKRRGVSERQEIALKLADAVDRALACTKPIEGDVELKHEVREVALTPRKVSKAERDVCASIRAEAITSLDPKSWWPELLQRSIDIHDGKVSPPPFVTELHALRIGDAVIVTNPFELFVDYGMRIKARSKAGQTFVAQLTNGTGLYLPTVRAVRGGSYGAMPAVCRVGPEGGDELVEHTLSLIDLVMTAN